MMSKIIKLRNPNYDNKGQLAPKNIYIICDRFISIKGLVTVYVNIYATPELAEIDKKIDRVSYVLTGIENDQSQLNPDFYLVKLIEQHGDEVLQGTALKDFIVLED